MKKYLNEEEEEVEGVMCSHRRPGISCLVRISMWRLCGCTSERAPIIRFQWMSTLARICVNNNKTMLTNKFNTLSLRTNFFSARSSFRCIFLPWSHCLFGFIFYFPTTSPLASIFLFSFCTPNVLQKKFICFFSLVSFHIFYIKYSYQRAQPSQRRESETKFVKFFW